MGPPYGKLPIRIPIPLPLLGVPGITISGVMDSCKVDMCPTLATECLTSSLRVTCIIRTYFKLALNIDLKAMDSD